MIEVLPLTRQMVQDRQRQAELDHRPSKGQHEDGDDHLARPGRPVET